MARRRVTVELELEVARANRSATELAVVLRGTKAQLENLGDEADGTSHDLDQLAANTDVAKKSVNSLGRVAVGTAAELALLDNRIKAAEHSVARLGLAFANGDTSVEKQLNSERSMLGQLRRVRKEIETGRKAFKSSSSNWFGGFDASGFLSEARGVGIGALVGLAALLAPAIGAMVSGAVVGAVAGGGIVGGIFAAAHDPRVAAAWGEFTPLLTRQTFGSDAFVAPVEQGIHRLRDLLLDLNIGDVFAKGNVAADELFSGIDGFVRNVMPGFDRVMAGSGSIMRVFGRGFADTGDAVSDLLVNLVESKGTLQGLQFLFMILNGAIRGTGEVLKWLGNGFHDFVAFNAWLSGNAEDVLGWVPWLGTRIREMNDNLEAVNYTGPITESALAGVSGALGAIKPTAESTADAIARVNKQFEAAYKNALSLIDANLAFEQALDDLSDSINKNGGTLDANTQQGRDNQRVLLDGIAAAKQARDVEIEKGQYTATANQLYQEQIEKLIKQAVYYGMDEQAVRNFIAALAAVPPTTTAQLILEMEARGIVPGEHSGPRVGDNPDSSPQGRSAADLAAEARAGGLRSPEGLLQDPVAAMLAARAEGRRAAGGSVLAGRLYRVNEQQKEYFQSATDGMVMPLSQAPAGAAFGGGNGPMTAYISIEVGGEVVRVVRTEINTASRATARRVTAGLPA